MFVYSRTVNYYETDKMGITHHSNYIRFMEEARVSFMDSIGWSYNKMEEAGICSPVVAVRCDFKKPTTFADKLEVEVSVKEMSQAKLTISYKMTSNEKVVCTAESEHCFLNQAGRPVSIKSVSEEFYNTLNSLLEQE